MLKLEGVTGGWGPTTIIEDLSLEVARGEVVSIVGRNGVGKTTTLEILTGRAQHHAGAIRLDGKSIHAMPTFERNASGLGYVPQGREVFPSLTVAENLAVAARPGEWNQSRLFDLFPSLARRHDSYGSQLSGGEQQMLSVARALVGNPKVVLLDEPTEGLAPIVVEQMIAALRQLAGTGTVSILLVEQVVDVALDLSNRCVIMDRGRIVHEAAPDALRGDRAFLQSLMGFEDAH